MHIGRLLRRPAMIMLEDVHQRLEQHGFGDVKPAHGAVFSYIGEGAQVTHMAELALTSKQNMSYLVDYLVKRGYVEPHDHGTDGRAKLFRLTKKGVACRQKSMDIIAEISEEWRAKLGAAKMEQLERLLTELNGALEGGIPLRITE